MAEYSAPAVLNYSKIYIGCQDAQVVRRSFLVVMAKVSSSMNKEVVPAMPQYYEY